MRRRVLILMSIAFGLWVVLAVGLWLAQDSIVFPGAGGAARPTGVTGVQEVPLEGPDGTFRVAQIVPRDPAAVIVFFVGNGEDLQSAGWRASVWAGHGLAAVCPEYPGYGGSEGVPGVGSILGAAEVAAEYAGRLAAQHGIPLIIGGVSLGSCPAVHVAALGHGDRLFLAAPMSSLLDVASGHYWWLPLRWMLRHRFDNMAAAKRVRCPVLVVHGARDRVIPLRHGERLFTQFGGERELVRVPDRGHNDLDLHAGTELGEFIGKFLRGE